MNDIVIRKAFHAKRLRRCHEDERTLVVDELGIRHGRSRADIAVINGHLVGYEIKSEVDSLERLERQVEAYGAIFDFAGLVTTERHASQALGILPEWWGVVLASQGIRGAVHFCSARPFRRNPDVDDLAVAGLLWRCECVALLSGLGVSSPDLRARRSVLYGRLVAALPSAELRATVRDAIRQRRGWRDLGPQSPSGDSSPLRPTC